MKGHRQTCKCPNCVGPNPVRQVRTTIQKMGFAIMSVCDGMNYTVGMCEGEKGGYEFVTIGIAAGASISVFKGVRENLVFVKSMLKQAESQDSDTVVFQNMIKYTNKEGVLVDGSVSMVRITPENQEKYITMHGKYYKHKNFTTYQCLICDAEGRGAFDEGYDRELIEAQTPLFKI